MGTVINKQFRIVSPYGPVTVKLDDVFMICRIRATASSIHNQWTVELRDKTRLTGTMIGKSFRVRTRRGIMVVPRDRIEYAIIAGDGKAIRMQCWGFDRIDGTLDASATISLKTVNGRTDLPAGKISVIAYGPPALKGHSGWVYTVAFSPDGKRLASGGGGGLIKFWDPATGKELMTLKGHSSGVNSISFSPDGGRLASGGGDSTRNEDTSVRIWDTVVGKEMFTIGDPRSRVHSVTFSADGKRLVSLSVDGRVTFWDPNADSRLLTTRKTSQYGMVSMVYSPDGKRLASGNWDTTASIWEGPRERFRLGGHSEAVYSVAFSPDGKRLATGSADKTVKIWDLATRKELLTLKGHPYAVVGLAFSPDGKRVASGSNGDKCVIIWDTATGDELFWLKGHADGLSSLRWSYGVHSLAFSPDGKQLATGSCDTIRIWDTACWSETAK